MYLGAMAYAVVPVASADLISALYTSVPAVMFLAKAGLASAFTFHSLNGIRHLV